MDQWPRIGEAAVIGDGGIWQGISGPVERGFFEPKKIIWPESAYCKKNELDWIVPKKKAVEPN